jgi:hypothetical protein
MKHLEDFDPIVIPRSWRGAGGEYRDVAGFIHAHADTNLASSATRAQFNREARTRRDSRRSRRHPPRPAA